MRLSTSLNASFWRKAFARGTSLVLALGGLVFLTGCDLAFWRMDGHQSTITVNGPVARSQRDLFYVTCWVTLVIFILVGSVLAYATWKFRAKSDHDENAEPPEQSHGNPLVEISLIVLSVIALVIIAIPTLTSLRYTYDVPVEHKGEAYEVTATGLQWWFRFEYPSEQISGAGPLMTSNELVIPANRPVRVNLRTADVIHSFWVPKLGGKVDMIPNRANALWLQADEPGYFWGQCAEYCGDSHAVMRFRVIALGPVEFAKWLDHQMEPARSVPVTTAATAAPKAQFAAMRTFKQNEGGFSDTWSENPKTAPLDSWRALSKPVPNEDPALIAQGRKLFSQKTCSNCHTIRGHEAAGTTAPDLTHVGSRSTIAAGLLENNAEQLRRWIHNPVLVKPGNKMYYGIGLNEDGMGGMAGYMKREVKDGPLVPNITLTPEDEVALVAYLQSLK